MITSSADTFIGAFRGGLFWEQARPTMSAALLFSPDGFRVEDESAIDNRYLAVGESVDPERAHAQHRDLANTIKRCGVPVVTIPGDPDLPDGVFGNNAFATIPKRMVIGAMYHPTRRGETKRKDVRALFEEVMGYTVVDLSVRDLVAEMTGPLVIDRLRGIGFCGMTARVDELGSIAMQEALDLRLTLRFDLGPSEYHTNVVMAVLSGRATVVHEASIAEPGMGEILEKIYPDAVLRISDEEKLGFVGNCIAVTPDDVLMSQRAADSLTPASQDFFSKHGFRVHAVDVSEFEKAGGSLRCMVTEIY